METPTAYIIIELLDGVSIQPTHYSLRYSPPGIHCGRDPVSFAWTLEAAAQLDGPFVMLNHVNGGVRNGGITAWTLEPPPSGAYSVFRLTVDASCLHVACFEVYGDPVVR